MQSFLVLKLINSRNIIIDEDKDVLDRVNRQFDLVNNNDDVIEQYVPDNVIKEAVIEDAKEETVNDTKMCSLCGHSVSSDFDVCPYCKKKF